MAVFAAVSAIFISAQALWQRNDYLKNYLANKDRYDAVREAIYEIPEDATVGATTFLCSTASQHRYIYDLKYSSHSHDLDYVILDLRYAEGRNRIAEFAMDTDYDQIFGIDNVILIYKRIK